MVASLVFSINVSTDWHHHIFGVFFWYFFYSLLLQPPAVVFVLEAFFPQSGFNTGEWHQLGYGPSGPRWKVLASVKLPPFLFDKVNELAVCFGLLSCWKMELFPIVLKHSYVDLQTKCCCTPLNSLCCCSWVLSSIKISEPVTEAGMKWQYLHYASYTVWLWPEPFSYTL